MARVVELKAVCLSASRMRVPTWVSAMHWTKRVTRIGTVDRVEAVAVNCSFAQLLSVRPAARRRLWQDDWGCGLERRRENGRGAASLSEERSDFIMKQKQTLVAAGSAERRALSYL
jgi:hypothetical protein